MARRTALRLLLSLILAAAAAGSVSAQAFGRLVLIVENPDGDRLEGVKVTAVCAEIPSFHDEQVTDQKGRANFSFADATQVYTFRFEAEGYQSLEAQLKPPLRTSKRQTITLMPTAAPPTAAAPTEEQQRGLTRAQRTFNEGVKAWQDGDPAAAEAKLREALEMDGKLAVAYSALASIYLEREDYEKALEAAQGYLELEPDNPRGLRLLYQAHLGLGHEKEAEAALEALSSLGQEGDAAALIYNEGVAALKAGDKATAKQRFAQAVEAQPDLAPAWNALAILQFNDGEYAAAAAAAERFLALEAGDLQAMRIRYDAYRLLGDTARAEEAFADLAGSDPKVVGQWFFDAGVELFDSGDPQAAAGQFEQALRLDPDNPDAHFRLALCYVNVDEPAKAREHFTRFLELAPEHPEAATAQQMLAYLE